MVGAGNGVKQAAQLLAEEGWPVVRLPQLARDRAPEELAGASVVVMGATGAPPDAPIELLTRSCPDAAFIIIAPPGTPPPDFDGLAPLRPRVVAVPLSRESLLSGLDSALLYRNLLLENRILRQELRAATRLEDWVGCSAAAASVRRAITTTAFSGGPVLILGEPGVGRRLAAELVHRLGRQAPLAFLPLEAGSLPPGELGSVFRELRRAGSSSGAPIRRARPGSVYLSSVEQLDAADQAVLEDAARRTPPFRLLVSASAAIRQQAAQGKFPPRLLQRLSASSIQIPPLRERREDVPALTLHFLSRACRRAGVGPYGISGATVEAYCSHHWPGNTAELRMWIERAVATAAVSRFSGPVLPDAVCSPPDGPVAAPARLDQRPLKEVLAGIEKALIQRALRRSGGSQKRAAQRLRVNPTTLHEKMKRHGLLRRSRRARS